MCVYRRAQGEGKTTTLILPYWSNQFCRRDLNNSFPVRHRLFLSLGATYWESMHLIYDQFYAYMCMSTPPFVVFIFLVRFIRSYSNECSMLMYCQEKPREKKNVTSTTRIISTSINQVDSSFSHGSILSIFLKYAEPEGNILTEKFDTLLTYAKMLRKTNFSINS